VACLVLAAGALLGTSLASSASTAGRCGSHAWCDTTLPAAQRARLLLDAMSLSDKVGILTGHAAPDVGLPAIRFTDGALGAGGLADGGLRSTAMPAGIALAANFDRRIAYRYGAVVGQEVRHRGFDGDYGPTVNIMRTPLGGRTFEAYGEDPFLAAQTAVGWIDGFQKQGVMADVKHFAANNQEGQLGVAPLTGLIGGRLFVDAHVDARELHEIEFPAFEAAVEQAHVATVMCSYNLLNGIYACANPSLLQSTLRDAWGFQGAVLSDAGACHEPPNDLAAGTDIDILGTCYLAPLVEASLITGATNVQTLDARVLDILRTLFTFGFFDRPAYPKDPALDDRAADDAAADAAEEGGMVLLRNDGVLPLQAGSVHSIAVIGPAADQYIYGGGSSQVIPHEKVTALDGIGARAAAAGIKVRYADGSDLAAAAALARISDVAIVVAADTESEGGDKPCMSLTEACSGGQPTPPDPAGTQATFGDQDALIASVAAANPRTVAVLETGAPVLTPWRGSLAALVEAWYPGEDGGTAIAHVLFGDASPGGRLPATFPATAGDIPTAAGGAAVYPGVLGGGPGLFQEYYYEGVMVGYRSYDSRGIVPAYPFGFGLSYTRLRFSALRVARRGVLVRVSVLVANVGRRAGWAVPELYVGLPSLPGVVEPPNQLAGFRKIYVAPGHSRRVAMSLDARSFSYWDTAAGGWRVAPGCDAIRVGSSSRSLPLRAVVAQGGANCGRRGELRVERPPAPALPAS
jgi:beta-glucosidase